MDFAPLCWKLIHKRSKLKEKVSEMFTVIGSIQPQFRGFKLP